MLKNKLLVLCMVLAVSPQAFSNDAEVTVQEARKLQAQIWKAEQEAKLREAQNRGLAGQTSTPVVQAVTVEKSDEIVFVGHYGVENDLQADFILNGVLITLSLRGNKQAGGWYLDALTPSLARICKGTNHKKRTCRNTPLATDRSALTRTVPPDSIVPAPAIDVPPIRPVAASIK